MTRSSLRILLGAGVCLVFAACGSDDTPTANDDSSESAALTKVQLVQRGDAVCGSSNRNLILITEQYEDEFISGDYSDEMIAEMISEFRSQSSALRDLKPSPSELNSYGQLLDELDSAIQQFESTPSALLDEASDPFAKANELAIDFGFEVCGDDGA